MKIVTLIARLLLGLIFVVFGLNGFLNFLSMGPMPSGLAGQFIGALALSHYFWVVAALQVVGGALFKKNLSKWAGLTLRWFRGFPTHDATNSFKLYDAEMLNTFTLESRGGFEISLEITVKAFLAGYRIAELPTTWRDRTQGESRFRLWHWLPLYLRWYFHAFRARSRMIPVTPRTS